MSIKKDDIKKLVELKYNNNFKVYYVNSSNGHKINTPSGVFISLGMTSSMERIKSIIDFINKEGEYSAALAEISSKKMPDGNYLNTVTKLNEKVKQFEIEKFDAAVMNRDASIKELESLKEKLKSFDYQSDQSILSRINRLDNLIKTLDENDSENGWNQHLLQKTDNSEMYRIYHKFLNYKEEGDVEKRVGIYVY